MLHVAFLQRKKSANIRDESIVTCAAGLQAFAGGRLCQVVQRGNRLNILALRGSIEAAGSPPFPSRGWMRPFHMKFAPIP
jgi:hypothetical protein